MAKIFHVKTLSSSKLFKNILVSFIFLLTFILIYFSKTDYFFINKLKTVSNTYIYSITKIVSIPMNFVSNMSIQIKEFRNLKNQNNILREEIMRLKKWQTLAIQNSSENKVLKKLLNATDNNLELIKTAAVIQRNDLLFAKIININAGINDGLRNQMAAINHRGMVGRTINLSKDHSKILLITDPNSSISVKTVSNEIFALIKGSEDGVHLVSSFIKNEKMPKIGDLIVTSGSAQIFPSDLLVGKIVKLSKNKFYVLPFVDFNNIEYVQIVKSK